MAYGPSVRPTPFPLTQVVQTLFDSVENARLVEYKLHRLEHHPTISGRMLNDLRRLRGLMSLWPPPEPYPAFWL